MKVKTEDTLSGFNIYFFFRTLKSIWTEEEIEELKTVVEVHRDSDSKYIEIVTVST